MAKSQSGKTRDPKWYAGTNQGEASAEKKPWIPAKFVRSELTAQEKEHVKSQQYVWDDIPEHINALVEAGYKLSISADKRTDAVAVWLSPIEDSNPNFGYVLSARGPDVLSALSVAIYKHYTKFDGVWPKDGDTQQLDSWA